jgi:CO/xanthine dehydrogenase Mo-binding subunit
MEPVNCTVHVRPDGCDIWVGTQVPTFARTAAAKLTSLPPDKVQVHNHLLGGGFGRRLEVDFIVRAVEIAKQVATPVKVVWTRKKTSSTTCTGLTTTIASLPAWTHAVDSSPPTHRDAVEFQDPLYPPHACRQDR